MTEREAFEKWALSKRWNLRRDGDGAYVRFGVAYTWEAWQAAIARQRRVIERLAGLLCAEFTVGWVANVGEYLHGEPYATREECQAAVIAWAETEGE